MDRFIVSGGKPLRGEVEICGAKNSAVAILPAAILSGGTCIIDNVPEIMDVRRMLRILETVGAKIETSGNRVVIDSSGVTSAEPPADEARKLRAAYYFLGVMLAKFGEASIALPGGCDLGPRPIDQHLKAFTAMGCEWRVDHGIVRVSAKSGRLHGARVFFDTVSVGATINAMLAASTADGLTVLENVAREPHIVDVANFINSMGGSIRGAGTDTIKIRGTRDLHPSEYSVVPDQIEAGTYMAAAVGTGGDIVIKDIIPKHLDVIIDKLIRVGAEVEEGDDSLRIFRHGALYSTNINTKPYPGFPTDMQPQMSVLLTVADGTSIVSEGIWDSRFKYAEELRRMGAKIQVDGKVAVIEGVEGLQGADVRATDLRAGAALVIAALMAEGRSRISDVQYIDRGYEKFTEKLSGLGADIVRETAE
ncbi:MAG: UDP-N-acetylglucosamine 1-carboxyvinyltransferase [Oscillospiraceae bacterium]